MKHIVFVAPAQLPIPVTKGGAIETLVQHLLQQNEIHRKVKLTVITPFDEKAYQLSLQYTATTFIWYRLNGFLEKIQNRLNRHLICPIKKEPFYSSWQGFVIKILSHLTFDEVIIENNIDFLWILQRHIDSNKIICHLHNRIVLSDSALDMCSRVLCVSEYIRREVIGQTHYDPAKLIVLKNCIDIKNFTPSNQLRASMRQKLGLAEHDIAICFVGRIVELKGVRHLIEAYNLIDKTNTKLFIVGSLGGNFGESTTGVSDFVEELFEYVQPFKDKVVFTGFIPNSEVHELLNAMDIAANPSLYLEAALVSNVEYQAMGLPVITTNKGGIPEYINQNSGYLLEANDELVNRIKDALEALISNPSLRKSMSIAARANALLFDRSRYYEEFLAIINSL